MPIEPTQLAAWRKLCDEATDGDVACEWGDDCYEVVSIGPTKSRPNDDWGLRVKFYRKVQDGINLCDDPECDCVQMSHEENKADAEFYAAARTALPLLLDEVEALQRRVAELEAEVARLTENASKFQAMFVAIPNMMLLLKLRGNGYKLTFTIDATTPGATQGARGMGNTIAEAVASLREQLGTIREA